MAERQTIKTSFASGEWAPKLRSRVDVQKYHSGAALLRNFYVDYSGGGASTRQGTKFIASVGANGARLVPFQPSTTVSYVLEFGEGYIRFYTNGHQVIFGGLPYEIMSPYAASDLFPDPITGNPGLKFVQDVTSLIICHPSYAPQILTITSATDWTLASINFGTTIATPTNLTSTSTDGAGTTWYYAYLITAVDVNGQESAPTAPTTLALTNYIGDATHPLSNTLAWTAAPGAVSYNVYKATPCYKSAVPSGAQYGFIGNITGTGFLDSYPGIFPDFSQTPPVTENPFQGAGVASYTVTNAGAYTTVPTVTVDAAPAGGTQATAVVTLGVISSALTNGGTGFTVGQIYQTAKSGFSTSQLPTIKVLTLGAGGAIATYSVIWPGSITSGNTPANNLIVKNPSAGSTNGGISATWGVTAVNPVMDGSGYTTVPNVTFSAGAGAATAALATASGGNPGVPGFLQTRLWLAGQPAAVQQVNLSQPGSFFNFNTSNPAQDDDAIQATIIGEELNDIRNLTAVPTGMLAFTGQGAWLLNGGGGISTMNPITPGNITAQPQSFMGANDLKPTKINMDVLYGTNKGNYIRDITYNIWMQIYSSADISTLSNHLFFGYYLSDWAWAEEPFKTMWAVRSDGDLLSLAYVKEQELIGWAHHDTNGRFLSVATVIETVNGNIVDAVYVIVERLVNGITGETVQYVERIADRYFPYGHEDAWSVDCALQTVPQLTSTDTLYFAGDCSVVGNGVDLTDPSGSDPFTAAMATNSWIVRAGGGIYKIMTFITPSQVTAQVVRVSPNLNTYPDVSNTTNVARPAQGFTIWQPVTSVSGLTQLENVTVTGVADGAVVTPRVVSGGGVVTLDTAASKVTLGLAFTPQLQTLPLDLGEPTVQGKRKKITALTLRVADTLGLSAGTTFSTLVPMKDFTLGNVPTTSTGVSAVTDLVDGDGRIIIDQAWQELGNYCVEQDKPYPATVLGVMPEVTVGDSAK